MGKLIDLTGQRFGKLTAIEKVDGPGTGAWWLCKCDCGRETAARATHLKSGNIRSCGCLQRQHLIDMVGKKFGRLTVLSRAQNTKDGFPQWCCICECGNEVIVRGKYLRNGHTKSCGCLLAETTRDHARENATHGLSYTRIYAIWNGMVNRCHSQESRAYKWYGARGIEVCDEWRNDVWAFYNWAHSAGYQDDLTIDRIDVNGPYSPENCRWVTMRTQANNTRSNKSATYKGKTQTISQWANEIGINESTLRWRLSHGWTIEKAISTTVRNISKKEAE